MKRLGMAAAALVLGTISTPYAASAQSFGVYVGSSGSSHGDYDDDIYYSGSYGRSAYYGGYGVPYPYPGGPRVYGYTQRVVDNRGGSYMRDGIPGGGSSSRTRVRSYEQRSAPDAIDRGDRRAAADRPGRVRDGIPGGAISARPGVAGETKRGAVIDRPTRSAGGCGTYLYWNGKACVDARAKSK